MQDLYKKRAVIQHSSVSKILNHSFILFLLVWGIFNVSLAHPSNVLQAVDYKNIGPKKTQVVLTFNNKLAKMRSFSTKAPDRVVLDLFGVTDGVRMRGYIVDKGVVHDITTVQDSKRTRIMLGLSEDASYRTSVVENKVYVTLTEKHEPVHKKANNYNFGANNWHKNKHDIHGIDFHRDKVGGGEVIVTLSDASMGINVNQDGDRVIVDFVDTGIKSSLQRRLDVTDFGTPVNSIRTLANGSDVKMVINVKEPYEHMAYQINNKFIIDLNPIEDGAADTGSGAAASSSEEVNYTGERLSLNFQDIEVRAILQILAEFTKINIVASDSVRGNITLRLNNVPWDEALAIVLRTQGLTQRKVGSVIMIAPAQEVVAREREELEAKQQVVALEPLQNAFITLNYAKADEVSELLKNDENSMISERGSISVDGRTNSLLLQDTGFVIGKVRKLINKLDVPVRQVLIEARIVNVNSDYERSIGIQWGVTHPTHVSGQLNGANAMQQNIIDGNVPLDDVPVSQRLNLSLPATSSTAPGIASLGVALAKLGRGYLLDLELSAIETEGGGEVISSPRLVTADQQEAYIESGEEIPYQEASASGATSVSFREAVLKLQVTPQITPDNKIIMNITVTQDKRSDQPEVLGTPAIDTRQIETKVLVDNGETIVLGGIYERTKTRTVNRIPFLGQIPVLGSLFRNTSEINDRKELLIFITPKIIETKTLAS